MPATILDVAKLAGVSKSTVSHVLNKTRFVAVETQEKVHAASESLNYQPSAVARSLKVKSTKSLGMIVTSTSNPFYAEVIREVERHCYDLGYNLILCNTEGDSEKTRSYMQMLGQKRADGILVLCSTYDDGIFSTIAEQKQLPMVVLDSGPSVEFIDKIQDHSHKGGLLATKHLIDIGHKDIAHIGGPLNKLPATQRLNGFKQAMEEAGLEVRPEWIVESDFECDGGQNAMRTLLKQAHLPTAIFVANDIMAMGVISEACQNGIRVPDDISIVGYDNISFSAYYNPPLTTVNQPIEELSKLAVKTLIKRISGSHETETVTMVEPNLVIRKSTKPIV